MVGGGESIKDGMPEGMRSGFQGLSAAICAQACVAAAGSGGKTTTFHPGQPGFAYFCKPYFAVYRRIFCRKFRKMRYFFAKSDGKAAKQSFAGYKNTAFLWEEPDTPECVFIASNSISYEICKEATKWQQAKKSE